MSIYSELLMLALAAQDEDDVHQLSVEDLVGRLSDFSVRLARHASNSQTGTAQAGDLTADLIAHDVALVQLCGRFGIAQSLTDPLSPPGERDRLITLLAEQRIDFSTGT